jgi:hypothetical protein
MVKYHSTERTIAVGDHVLYGGTPAQIVFIIEEERYLPGYLQKDWEYLHKGVGIKTERGDLFCIDEPDENEDLVPQSGL